MQSKTCVEKFGSHRKDHWSFLFRLQRTWAWISRVGLSALMAIALSEAGISAELEVPVPVWFHGQQVGDFRADLVVERLIFLELKTAKAIDRSHEGQMLHYLRATEFEVGLLLNFGPQRHFKRFILENTNKKSARSLRSTVSSS
jgi:GxxExxY protein